MKKTHFLMMLAALLVAMGMLAAPAMAADFDLYAGQDQLVGHIEVTNTLDQVNVKYVLNQTTIDAGWLITEVHLSIGDAVADIPQTKKFSPIPGQFTVNEAFAPGVTETPVYAFDREAGWDAGDELVIAAHSVVAREDCVVNATAPYGPIEVADSVQGLRYDYTAVKTIRSNPNAALVYEGTKLESDFFSLGFREDRAEYLPLDDSYLVVRFDTPVLNGAGADLRVVEDTWGLPYPIESCDVWVKSAAEDAWTYLGSANNQTPLPDGVHTFTDLDLDSVGLASISYVKVQDTSVRSAFASLFASQGATLDGFDVNAILSLQDNKECTTYSETAWSAGTCFDGANWATYSTYTIEAPVLVDTVKVYPFGTNPYVGNPYPSTISLNAGETYLLKASGTYRFANWGEYGIADAAWNYRFGIYSPTGDPGWFQQESTRLQVWIGGAAVAWQPSTFNPEHVYTLELTGTGAPVVFTISDDQYNDNSGYITVEIYQ